MPCLLECENGSIELDCMYGDCYTCCSIGIAFFMMNQTSAYVVLTIRYASKDIAQDENEVHNDDFLRISPYSNIVLVHFWIVILSRVGL